MFFTQFYCTVDIFYMIILVISFMQGTVVDHFCNELNASATTEDKSDDSMGNFMRN